MKYFVNLIMPGVLICAACFASCKDSENEGDDTSVRTVVPSQSSVFVMEGATISLAATVAPDGAGQGINWTSDNPTVASVNSKGIIDGISTSLITGVSTGSTVVTATSASDPGKKATVEVTVTTHIDSVALDTDRITFILGDTETATVEATVKPANAIQTVTWTSSNTDVVTVSNGVIRAVKVGVATITAASTIDPTKKATVEVQILSLVNKVIHVASKFSNGLTVSWVNLGGDLVEFFYTNEAGQETSTIMPVTTQSSYIPDFGSAPLSFRTLYLSGGTNDTIAAPLVNFTGGIYDLKNYIRSSPTENVIRACDFDIGGEGIGFHDADNTNSAYSYRRDRGDTRSDAVGITFEAPYNGAIGWLHNTFWVNYTVDVIDAGNYEIDFHVSVNGSGARCRIEADGSLSEEYPMNNNGSWYDWRYYCEFNRIDPPVYYLSAGKHVVKFYSMSGNYNYNGIRLTYKP
jgi:hypothetical protein